MSASEGVSFPSDSSTSAARTIMADALRMADPVGSRAIENETAWRRHYVTHFRRAVEAGVGDAAAARAIASDGLRSAHNLMRFGDVPLDEAIRGTALTQAFHTRTVHGTADAETELSIPYRGERLKGSALVDQLERWVKDGIITRSAADAVLSVQDNPSWLRLEGDTVVVLGAGAEMGPYRALLRWGAEVVAIDLPRQDVQQRVRAQATELAGTTHVPARIVTQGDDDSGADLLTELPGIAHWLDAMPGRLVLGNYCYADGGTHVRLSMAADALAEHLTQHRPDTALAFLATPTDIFAVPAEEVGFANQAYADGSRLLRGPVRLISGGRLLQRHYAPGADPGLCDALVPQQGPNYALAKRLQRWRATASRAAGTTVSLNVAPATRTRSVVKNKALAAAYAGSHRFGVEIFDPATSNTLMAALLVHDLRAGAAPQAEPWQDEADGAAHGGLWTTAYDPRSALGLAAVLGLGSLRP